MIIVRSSSGSYKKFILGVFYAGTHYFFEPIRFSVPEITRFILSICLMKIRMAITTPSRITGDGQENASISSGMVAEAASEARET
jgi:hypothetical protein